MQPEDLELERELRQYYFETADDRHAALEAALASARGAPADEARVGKLRDAIHKVAGSAGMYGFPELSRAAKVVEQAIIEAARCLPAPPALFADVEAFCARVVREIAEAREGARPAPAPSGSPASSGSTGPSGSPSASAGDARPPAVLGETRRRLVVAVLSDPSGPASALEAGREVGRELARAGAHLLIGRAHGAPLEAARSFREEGGGGIVIAALAGEERTVAAPWVDLPLPTGLGPGLAALLPLWADAAVLVGGGAAALAEAALFLHHGKPVAALPDTGGAAAMVSAASFEGHAPFAATDAQGAVLGLLQALAAASSR